MDCFVDAQLTPEELKANYEKERDKLKEMLPETTVANVPAGKHSTPGLFVISTDCKDVMDGATDHQFNFPP